MSSALELCILYSALSEIVSLVTTCSVNSQLQIRNLESQTFCYEQKV